MEVQQDFKELLKLFNAFRVEYIVVGAYALAYHGVPRYTGDIDIWIKPDSVNAEKIMAALDEFGFGSVGLIKSDFIYPEKVIQLGVPPIRIDLVTSITGVAWEEGMTGRAKGTYGDIPVFYIGRNEFITNKRAIGRKKDFADLEALGED